jgi:hypothetical protein
MRWTLRRRHAKPFEKESVSLKPEMRDILLDLDGVYERRGSDREPDGTGDRSDEPRASSEPSPS